MFNFFKKSSPKIKVVDKVWMSPEAKWKACSQMQSENPDCLFVAWFTDTSDEGTPWINAEFEGKPTFCLADDPAVGRAQGRTIIFVEHHPLVSKEQKLFQTLGLEEVTVLSSLSEPLFQHFGGTDVIALMKQLGMKDDDVIEHSMASSSISKAQKKIEKTIKVERSARTLSEWFKINGFGDRK